MHRLALDDEKARLAFATLFAGAKVPAPIVAAIALGAVGSWCERTPARTPNAAGKKLRHKKNAWEVKEATAQSLNATFANGLSPWFQLVFAVKMFCLAPRVPFPNMRGRP